MNPPEPFRSRSQSRGHLRVVLPHTARETAGRDEASAREVTSLDDAYRRFAPYVAAIAVRILGRSDELDDLVQDVFVEATRGIAALTDPRAIKGWLARIAVRVSVRRLRRRRLLRALFLSVDEGPDYEALAAPGATPEQRAMIARVYRALDGLPAAERAAWVLRHVHGATLDEAAALCACSLSTYQRRLSRASAHLDLELPDE